MSTRRQLPSALPAAALLCALLAGLDPAPARASEEMIYPWRRAEVTVTTGSFGDVQVSWSATPGKPTLDALTVKLRGKALGVPARALKALKGVDPAAMAVHTEPGYDKHPWLYVVFELLPPHGRGVARRWGDVAFQSGKLAHVSVKSRTSDNQYRFEKLRY